jgi:hypothetical protein
MDDPLEVLDHALCELGASRRLDALLGFDGLVVR